MGGYRSSNWPSSTWLRRRSVRKHSAWRLGSGGPFPGTQIGSLEFCLLLRAEESRVGSGGKQHNGPELRVSRYAALAGCSSYWLRCLPLTLGLAPLTRIGRCCTQVSVLVPALRSSLPIGHALVIFGRPLALPSPALLAHCLRDEETKREVR